MPSGVPIGPLNIRTLASEIGVRLPNRLTALLASNCSGIRVPREI